MVEVLGSSSSSAADPEAEAEAAAGDYYRTAGVEEREYTYENLGSSTRSSFTRDELVPEEIL